MKKKPDNDFFNEYLAKLIDPSTFSEYSEDVKEEIKDALEYGYGMGYDKGFWEHRSELSEAKATMIVNYGYPARAGQGKLIEETDSLHAMLVTVLTHYHEALKALQNQTS